MRSDFSAAFDDKCSDGKRALETPSSASWTGVASQGVYCGATWHYDWDDGVSRLVTLPASLLTGQLIQTPQDQDLSLLLPSRPELTSHTDLRFAYASSASCESTSIDTRNKRWTLDEDMQLKFAVAKEAGPPHNWKEIARLYFSGTRTSCQVCYRLRPVDGSMAEIILTLCQIIASFPVQATLEENQPFHRQFQIFCGRRQNYH